jgi:hypothetical protein
LYEFRLAALRIEVFIAKDQMAAVLGGALGGSPESASVPEMQQASGRRSEAAAVRRVEVGRHGFVGLVV